MRIPQQLLLLLLATMTSNAVIGVSVGTTWVDKRQNAGQAMGEPIANVPTDALASGQAVGSSSTSSNGGAVAINPKAPNTAAIASISTAAVAPAVVVPLSSTTLLSSIAYATTTETKAIASSTTISSSTTTLSFAAIETTSSKNIITTSPSAVSTRSLSSSTAAPSSTTITTSPTSTSEKTAGTGSIFSKSNKLFPVAIAIVTIAGALCALILVALARFCIHRHSYGGGRGGGAYEIGSDSDGRGGFGSTFSIARRRGGSEKRRSRVGLLDDEFDDAVQKSDFLDETDNTRAILATPPHDDGMRMGMPVGWQTVIEEDERGVYDDNDYREEERRRRRQSQPFPSFSQQQHNRRRTTSLVPDQPDLRITSPSPTSSHREVQRDLPSPSSHSPEADMGMELGGSSHHLHPFWRPQNGSYSSTRSGNFLTDNEYSSSSVSSVLPPTTVIRSPSKIHESRLLPSTGLPDLPEKSHPPREFSNCPHHPSSLQYQQQQQLQQQQRSGATGQEVTWLPQEFYRS